MVGAKVRIRGRGDGDAAPSGSDGPGKEQNRRERRKNSDREGAKQQDKKADAVKGAGRKDGKDGKGSKGGKDGKNVNVSSRCIFSTQTISIPYKKSMSKALTDPCHPINNRTGYIVLCRAENKLVTKELSKRLARESVAKIAFGDETTYRYDDVRGLYSAREAIARFLMKHFINHSPSYSTKDDVPTGVTSTLPSPSQFIIQPEQIVIGSGATSILSYLFYFLAEEKDVVLIPAPYYAAFDGDTKLIAGCLTYPVYMEDPSKGPRPDELDVVHKNLTRKGLNVKLLLLTNPNNPLGTVYSPTVIQDCIDWARSKNMHSIVDEIYALSVHDGNETNSFQSVIRVLQNKLKDDVHFVWALSKDFGSSGFRFGVLYTQNKSILSAFANINLFSSVSHPIQAVVADILLDDRFVDRFLGISRNLLRTSYEIVTLGLDAMQIPFVPAKAGIFVYCDFSSLLQVKSFEGEDEIARLFEEHVRIIMTPGGCQRDSKPGFFRICYAFVTPDVLKIGIARLHMVCTFIREHGWEDIQMRIDKSIVLNC